MPFSKIQIILFVFPTGAGDVLNFRCTTQGCRGRVKVDEGYENLEIKNPNHDHPPRPHEVSIRKVISEIRDKAIETTEAMPNIYRTCTAQLANDPSAAAIMPSFHSIDSGLYRQRRRLLPALPQTREQVNIPDVYKNTLSGERFLLSHSKNKNTVIFCTPSNLSLLCQSKLICLDGTFDCVPHLYSQLLTVHAFENGKLLPLVYCLMSSKARSDYVEIFSILKQRAQAVNLSLAPSTFMSDFESGIIAAVRDEFPNAHHQGCYFHFTQVNLLLIYFSKKLVLCEVFCFRQFQFTRQ